LDWLGPGLMLLLLLAGCTAKHYRKSADRSAYGAIKAKTPQVRNMDSRFTIEQTNAIALGRYPVSTNINDYLGAEGENERDAHILRLDDALEIAVHHSRNYQNQKEKLYLTGLSLTFIRHEFTPIFSGSGTAKIEGRSEEAAQVVSNTITHLLTTNVVFKSSEDFRASGSINVDWLIRDVGKISAAFTADFLRFVSGDPRIITSSQLSAQFVRPLVRDAGFKRDKEALIQAERDLLYALRDFTQFRKDFSVQIARSYYGVLGFRDTARNNYLNFQSSRKNAERVRAMVEEGRNTTAELGRLEQQELNSESSWINAVRNYQGALDNFKIDLGLTVDSKVVLDDRELEVLQILHPDLTVDDSIKVAFEARLDYLNAKDEFEDAERHVKLAENFLKPQINLVAGASIVSDPNKNTGFQLPDPRRYSWDAGLAVDPGFDRTSERNAYRSALISRNSAARSVEQREDDIKLKVRESWRTLDKAKRDYEISEIGVKIAERRVEEQELLAEVGRAKAQDQVDAQNDLIASKNQRTQALVTHTIARLQFWNNMGILYIKDDGQWEELHDEKAK
jgi:outer membrane protein TolC